MFFMNAYIRGPTVEPPTQQEEKTSLFYDDDNKSSKKLVSRRRDLIAYQCILGIAILILVIGTTREITHTVDKTNALISTDAPLSTSLSLSSTSEQAHWSLSLENLKSTDPKCAHVNIYGDRSPEITEKDSIQSRSIFNCGSTHGKCTWYYPAKFFDPTCGYGRNYTHWLEYMETQRRGKKLWTGGMPPIVLPWASLSPNIKPSFRSEPFPQHNLSMIHVHKTGGTSMVLAFAHLLSLGAKGQRHIVYLSSKPEPSASIEYNESSLLLDHAVKYQKDWKQQDHTLMAVVRDPAERFISAIGQVMGAQGSQTQISTEIRKECLKHDAKSTIRCCIDMIQSKGFWFEVHFTPMVLEISFASMFKDIPIAVFPFLAVPDIMYELDVDPNLKRKDGSEPGYRKDPILTNMTMSDYDPSLLRDLCEIYTVDTIFLHYLGYETSCDKYTSLLFTDKTKKLRGKVR